MTFQGAGVENLLSFALFLQIIRAPSSETSGGLRVPRTEICPAHDIGYQELLTTSVFRPVELSILRILVRAP